MLKRYYNRAIIFGRGDSMRKIDKGFSLVELLIVVVILGILAGILYLVLGPSDEKAKKEACYGNRATVLLALDSYRFSSGVSKETYTLQNFIDDDYKDTISNKEVKCPSGGIYSAGTSNGREAVVCSIHGGDSPGGGDGPGGGGPGHAGTIIPGTDLFGGDGIEAPTNWVDPANYHTDGTNNYISVEKGERLYFDTPDGEREYYISLVDDEDIMFNGSNRDADGNIITAPDNLPGWVSEFGTGLVRFTGVSVNWDDVPVGYQFFRGDIVYYNGAYYVCIVRALLPGQTPRSWDTMYVKAPLNWNETPETTGKNAWYKLSSN